VEEYPQLLKEYEEAVANRVSGTETGAATGEKEGRPETDSASNDEARSTGVGNEAAGVTRQHSSKKKKGAFDFDDEEDVENGNRTPDQSMDDNVDIEAQGEAEQEEDADNDGGLSEDAGVDAEDAADEAPPLPPLAYFTDYGNRVCFLNLAEWIICYQDTFLEGQGAAGMRTWDLPCSEML
jgi:hypothetical protein